MEARTCRNGHTVTPENALGNGRCRECLYKRLRESEARLRADVALAYGDSSGGCTGCHRQGLLGRDLVLDHANNDGAAHRAKVVAEIGGTKATGNVFYRYLKKRGFPQDLGLQVLCNECHDQKTATEQRQSSTTVREREYEQERARLRRIRDREEVFLAYGGACACCGKTGGTMGQDYQLDHANGDGAEHRLALFQDSGRVGGLSGGRLYAKLRSQGYPQDLGLQVLCTDCHKAKTRRESRTRTQPHRSHLV